MSGCADQNPMPEAARFRRAPATVMRLARMGSFHQTRLSFMRALLRRMRRENWEFDVPVWDIGADGVGRAVYRAKGPQRTYSLVAFAHDLPDEMRSDRVIATAWDATFTLFDGEPTTEDLDRLEANVPLQEAGRVSDQELSLSRANRSVRLWEHVVGSLARGEQPDMERVYAVGYLMRTTAVYGSGKFGAADRDKIAAREELRGPFRVEMLSVYLTRAFVLDLVEHMARVRGGDQATVLAPENRRWFGIGNSTGLGMAPFLIHHPVLLNNWMLAREEALARVRSQPAATVEVFRKFSVMVKRARLNAEWWRSEHPIQIEKLTALRGDLDQLAAHCATFDLSVPYPWDRLYRWGEDSLSLEGQEILAALMLEPHGALVDGLSDCMDADEAAPFRIDGTMPLEDFSALVEAKYAWARDPDYAARESNARFWYVSEEKLEPRLGERFEEPGAEYEQPLAIGRDAAGLADALDAFEGKGACLADFLLAHPEHRHIARRVLAAARHPFAEIWDNLIAADMLPIDLLRCKLSFFGANRFDPRSDRWVRICMFQNAPFPQELALEPEDDWAYPPLEGVTT